MASFLNNFFLIFDRRKKCGPLNLLPSRYLKAITFDSKILKDMVVVVTTKVERTFAEKNYWERFMQIFN